ncbi:MAG: DNA replication and repair protein RecF [Candidatus Daviesbacteria bacterium]|nr:MAG: DNA replication and repair protein RecF [Candidatus Daviesbacteria bacterium]
MILKQLKLTNFRNYSNLSLDFDQRSTILLGNNAVGKSNLLEAIYFLSTSKSSRTALELELIKKGETFATVEGQIEDDSHFSLQLQINMQLLGEYRKKVSVNRLSRRVVDYLGNFPAVMFSPVDINMVIGAPSLRRWHLDLSLAQVDAHYKKALTLYEQYLVNRNRVLKRIREGLSRADELTFWTGELIKQGEIISSARAAFLESLNSFQALGNFRFAYQQSLITQERLREYSTREIAVASTLIGPHRDDFTVEMGERNLAHFGSRGEQRMATLAFKLATLEYMSLTLGKRPILLLDDVFSELDASHRAAVVEIVSRQQTIMATVELENIPQEFLDSARILKIEDGVIKGL